MPDADQKRIFDRVLNGVVKSREKREHIPYGKRDQKSCYQQHDQHGFSDKIRNGADIDQFPVLQHS